MSFEFSCTQCGKTYHGDEKIAGKRMKCQKCGTILRIPIPREMAVKEPQSLGRDDNAGTAQELATTQARPAKTHSHSVPELVACPHCNSSCRIQSDWRGRSIQCPKCNKPFTAPTAETLQKLTKPTPTLKPESVPGDSEEDPGFAVAEEEGTPLVEVVSEEGPEATERPTPPVASAKRRKKSKLGGAFGEWIRGPGLWVLDAVGVSLMIGGTLLSKGNPPAGANPAYKMGFVAGLICAFVIFLPLALAIGALLLRLACRFCSVAVPEFVRCMGIVCLIGSVQWPINQVAELLLSVGNPQQQSAGAIVATIAINLVVGAAASIPVLILTLEIPVGRAALVWLIEMALVIAVVIVVVVVIFGIALAMGISMGLRGVNPAVSPEMPVPGQQFPGVPSVPGQQFPGMPQSPDGQFPGIPQMPGQPLPGQPPGPGQQPPGAPPGQ